MKKTGLLTRSGADGPILHFVHPSVVLGSGAACEIQVKSAAPRHCQVFQAHEGYEVRDLTGQGLIEVNGKRAFGAVLKEGDVLKVGSDSFAFSEVFEAGIEEPPAAETRRSSRASKTELLRAIAPGVVPPAPRPRWRHAAVPVAAAAVLVIGLVVLVSGSDRSSFAPTTPKSAKASTSASVPMDRSTIVPETADAPAAAPPAANEERPAPAPVVPSPSPVAGTGFRRETPAPSLSGLDAFLKDPARRGAAREREAMAQLLRSASLDSEVLRALAVSLAASPSPWELGPSQARVWSAYVQDTPFDALGKLSAADHLSRARTLLDAGSVPLFRLFALAHLVEALPEDPNASRHLTAAGFRLSADGKMWGESDLVALRQVTQDYRDPSREDLALETRAASSPHFATRYVGLLMEVRRSLARGSGLQSTFNDLSACGAPPEIAGHLRALALSYRKAVYCRECKDGRLACPQCQGKTRIDLPCTVCRGEGRVMAPGAVDGAIVTQKCRNCDGRKVFRGVGCPTCSRTGTVGCTSCGGNPWRDSGCANPGCRSGWMRCETCRGGGRVDVPCPDCNGTGRVMAPGAANGARVTQKCRTCNEDHGVFKKAGKCQSCGGNGLVRCGVCQGKPGDRRSAVAPLSAVFTTEPCSDCAGTGWPCLRMAVPCPRCLGLGLRIKPS